MYSNASVTLRKSPRRDEIASPRRLAAGRGQAVERTSMREMREELHRLRAEHEVLKARQVAHFLYNQKDRKSAQTCL